MSALLAFAILAVLTGLSAFASVAPTPAHLTGMEILNLCYEVQLTSTEAYYESDSKILETKHDFIVDSMTKIINSTKENLRVDHYGVGTLQKFLTDIRDIHLKELETLVKEKQQRLSEDTEGYNRHIWKKKIESNIGKIYAKLLAVQSEWEKNRRLLTSNGRNLLINALEMLDAIIGSLKSKNLDEVLERIPPFVEEIKKFHFA